MKIDAFLFLQRSDIAHFASRAADFEGVPQIFIDPGLMDSALQHGIDPRRFDYRPLDVGRHLHARIASEAFTRATALDQALTRERQRVFGAGLLQGWDQGTLRHFFLRLLTAKYLGQVCDRTFPEAAIGLFRPTKPQHFYFDSFLATDLFADALDRWRVVDHYDTVANWVHDSTTMCFDFTRIRARVEAGSAHAVTHIPTCYTYQQQFTAEIVRAFPTNIDLPSPFWDIPVRRDQALRVHVDAVPAEYFDQACILYRERARQVLQEYLGELIPNRQALTTQVELMAAQRFVQALNYQGLLKALRGARPHFVVTDHDTGSSGPLFSVAERLGSPITVLPHSSYPTGAIPHPIDVHAVEREGFGTPVRSVWGEKVPTVGIRLGKPGVRVDRHKVKTVCLLLNTMFSQGLSYIDFAGMASFHASLVQLCARHGASLLVRLKPNGAGVTVAANALRVGIDDLTTVLRAPIAEVASLTDLCITYGEPTSAGIDFLCCGSYMVHTSEQLWPSDHLNSPAYIGDGLVPSFCDAEALVEVEALLADEFHFRSLAARQGEAFERRLGAAAERIFNPA